MATKHGPYTTPVRIDPRELMDPANQTRGNRWSIVVMAPDEQGAVIGKHETHAPILIPDVGDVIVLEVPDVAKMSDGTYPYDVTAGYQD